MSLFHLPKRFFGSLSRRELGEEDRAWVYSKLLPAEQELWNRMSRADQRHACEVARRTVKILGEEKATRPVVAAALLHDIGKVEVHVNTFERVMATLAGSVSTEDQRKQWATETGWIGKAGRYLIHNEIGAKMLEEAGSDPLTITWAYEHELVHTKWTLPPEITDALYKADNV